jgi:hypothetical protein
MIFSELPKRPSADASDTGGLRQRDDVRNLGKVRDEPLTVRL